MDSREPQLLVDETVLVFAFRYALGRCTAAPWYVINTLRQHWAVLQPWTQQQIQDETGQAIDMMDAGHAHHVQEWTEVLTWAVKTNPYSPL